MPREHYHQAPDMFSIAEAPSEDLSNSNGEGKNINERMEEHPAVNVDYDIKLHNVQELRARGRAGSKPLIEGEELIMVAGFGEIKLVFFPTDSGFSTRSAFSAQQDEQPRGGRRSSG